MSKLTKAQAKAHQQACELLKKDRLTPDDCWFVLENWQESANHINSIAGAFFTPAGLAADLAIEVAWSRRTIDLCAGIGALSYAAWSRYWSEPKPEIVCVEKNPGYVEVGRKIFPDATWIEGDVFDLPDLGHFDIAIANPPFGATKRSGSAPRYTGTTFEYHVIDIASDLADYGVFIIPQNSAPFRFSGEPHYREAASKQYAEFSRKTEIELAAGCGVDCEYYRPGWRGVAPKVEIVLADFIEARERRQAAKPERLSIAIPTVTIPEQIDLFGQRDVA